MKKTTTLFMLLMAISFGSQAQYYFNTYIPAGMNPGNLNNDAEQPGEAGYTDIIAAGTTTLSWSSVQTIPFSFDFDGSPVTQYKVSNSGVLTFTTSATTVPPNANVALPSASIPDKSVMVWGLQQAAGNDVVRTKTFGVAPNRQHWVYFASFSSPQSSGTNWTYWGIVLEETSNKIYMVDMRTYLTPLSLTIGIQTNSTTAYQIPSAPNTPSVVTNGGSAADATDNSYYEFIQGVPAANDIELSSLNLNAVAVSGSNVTVSGTIKNFGSITQDTVTVSWSVNNGTVNSQTYTGLNLANLATFNFNHSATWTASNAGSFANFKVWTTMASGRVDVNNLNDTLTGQVFVNLGNTIPRKVLLEEYTTAVCQFCPDGTVYVENILNTNPNVIAVGVHACFGTDAMTTSEASVICSTLGSNSAPTGMVDRIVFPGDPTAAFSRSLWASRASARASVGSPVDINFSGNYNPSLNYVPVTVTTSFVDYPLPGNINVSVIVVEDSVVGPNNSGYNQINAYNTQAGHPFFGAGNPIIGFVHRHVMRDVWPVTFGDQNVFPANIALNTPYSVTYNIPLNAAWNRSRLSLVAIVNYAGPGIENYEVLNAKEIHIEDLTTGITEENKAIQNFTISPVPVINFTNVNFTLAAKHNVNVMVYDVAGKKVLTENFGVLNQGSQKVRLDFDAVPNGIYFVKVQAGKDQMIRKIVVQK